MRKVVVTLCVAGLGVSVYAEGIRWFMEEGYAYYNGGTVFLDGHASSNIGCFVQLLWVGPNGVPDQAYAWGNGTGPTDDVVVDWRWIGAGAAGGNDGWFAGGDIAAGGQIISNRVYFARFWTAPSPDYANGLVPTSLTNYYANGPTWTYPHSNPIRDDFDVVYSGNIVCNLSPLPIPEPAMMGLVLVGLGGLRVMRRRAA